MEPYTTLKTTETTQRRSSWVEDDLKQSQKRFGRESRTNKIELGTKMHKKTLKRIRRGRNPTKCSKEQNH